MTAGQLGSLAAESVGTSTQQSTDPAGPSLSALDIYRFLVRARDKAFSLLAGRSFHAYGRHSVLQLPIRLSGESRIDIGDDVFIGAGSWLQVIGNAGDDPAITVGSGTSIAGNCVLSAARSITIGRRALFARNVYIADHVHAFANVEHAVLDQGVTSVAPVEVGDGAWLGQNVVVGPGVRIGRGAVVGANSFVRDDVPDFAVAVGSPARVIRSLAPDPKDGA